MLIMVLFQHKDYLISSNIFSKNFRRKGQRNRIFSYIFSQMRSKKSFFAIDSILFKIMYEKLKKSDREMEDLLFKEIISKCVEEKYN